MSPGILIYLDSYKSLAELSDEECGQLLKNLLIYAKTHASPSFNNDKLRVLFPMFAATIDRDQKKYEKKRMTSSYAAYCREEQKKGNTPIPFEDYEKSRQLAEL